jgi:lysophosphatidate acyltransferase
VTNLSSLVRVFAGLIVMAVAAIIFMLVCVVLLPSRSLRIRACNVFGHITGRSILWIAGARVPRGLRRAVDGVFPAIYISNHTSPTDIFLGIWLAPMGTCGVAKKEVVWYPFFGQLYAISGHLRLDRSNRENAVEALRSTAEVVRRHHLGVWIWPEGTRARDGRLLPFKKGFAHLALATGLPIVPVVVSGAHHSWRKNSLLIEPTTLGVRVLPPIPTTDWHIETLDAHIAQVRQVFLDNLPDEQQPLPVAEVPRAVSGVR